MSGDFVALNFEYFAETWFDIQQSGQTTDVNDYAAITLIGQLEATTTVV